MSFVGRIAAELRDEGLVARTVVLKLRHGDFHTVTRRRTLPTATDLDQELLVPARELFRVAFPEAGRRRQGIRLIGVAATNLTQAAAADLFEPAEAHAASRANQRGGPVRERFGFDAVAPAQTLKLKRSEPE